jgi:hypothetical protein
VSTTFLSVGSECGREVYRHESVFHGHGSIERGDECFSIGVGSLDVKRIKDFQDAELPDLLCSVHWICVSRALKTYTNL